MASSGGIAGFPLLASLCGDVNKAEQKSVNEKSFFTIFNDDEDVAAYEDDLYREESSSDESIDSEVECHLYSQVHYSQDLSKVAIEELDETDNGMNGDLSEVTLDLNVEPKKGKNSVITISDSDDIKASDSSALILSDSLEEESVYFSKIRGKVLGAVNLPGNQSTPKVPTRKKRSKADRSRSLNSSKSYKAGFVQEILVIRGSSDEDDVHANEKIILSSDSDQSDVENWMLLGRGREEGDASIQLNLDGCRQSYVEDNNEMEWSISEKDLAVQIGNYTSFRRCSRYYTDKNVICKNCNQRGHLSKNCSVAKKLSACCLCGRRGHLQFSCPVPYCSNCFLPGHFYADCTERPNWQKNCHRCSMYGHFADGCPEIWRQYHLTVKPGPIKNAVSGSSHKETVYCCNCGRKGHCGYECKERRMYSRVSPNCELIFTYDRKNDIWKRNQRAIKRFEGLQEAGLVPLQSNESTQNVVHFTKLPKKIRKRLQRDVKHQKKEVIRHLNAIQQSQKGKRSRFLYSQETEEDFPRGKSEKSKEARRPHAKRKTEHFLFKDPSKKSERGGLSKKLKQKRRRKAGNKSHVDESLLIIKQRKKKSRKGFD